jgi:hypothetical protein
MHARQALQLGGIGAMLRYGHEVHVAAVTAEVSEGYRPGQVQAPNESRHHRISSPKKAGCRARDLAGNAGRLLTGQLNSPNITPLHCRTLL